MSTAYVIGSRHTKNSDILKMIMNAMPGTASFFAYSLGIDLKEVRIGLQRLSKAGVIATHSEDYYTRRTEPDTRPKNQNGSLGIECTWETLYHANRTHARPPHHETRDGKWCGIYKIVGPEGKMYIGQSHNIEKRFEQHKIVVLQPDTYYKQSFKYDVAQYGMEWFTFHIIEQIHPSLLNERELYWIKYYKTNESGYNNQSEVERLSYFCREPYIVKVRRGGRLSVSGFPLNGIWTTRPKKVKVVFQFIESRETI